jgi:hypothetical protein
MVMCRKTPKSACGVQGWWCGVAESLVDMVSHLRNNASHHGYWLQTTAALMAWHTHNVYTRQ